MSIVPEVTYTSNTIAVRRPELLWELDRLHMGKRAIGANWEDGEHHAGGTRPRPNGKGSQSGQQFSFRSMNAVPAHSPLWLPGLRRGCAGRYRARPNAP